MFNEIIKLIDCDGKFLGLFNYIESLNIAKKRELDLLEINPNSKPRVFKILDKKKYLYYKKKNLKKNKKKLIKEVKIRINTFKQDFFVKIKKIIKFLKLNLVIKITIVFKGREIYNNRSKAFQMVFNIKNHLKCLYKNIKTPVFIGNYYVLFIYPKN